MKLPIDYSQAVNTRVLHGVVIAVDPVLKTVSVSLPSGIVDQVPVHYLCDHNLDDHGTRRVFRAGDAVLVIYTGSGQRPSSSNTVVIALKDEVRACRKNKIAARPAVAPAGFILCGPQYSQSIESFWPFYTSTAVEENIERGNYHIIYSVDGYVDAYSIKAPIHHLADDNSTGFGTVVYQGGRVVASGVPGALILGIGLDVANRLHMAQLLQIPYNSGYFTIYDHSFNVVGFFFGTIAGAAAKADDIDGSFSTVWINEDMEREWFVEFHSSNWLGRDMIRELNIYRREQASRYGNRQWFFNPDDGAWKQADVAIHSTFAFSGLEEIAGGLKKTVYTQTPVAPPIWNGKEIASTHTSTSESGVTGSYTEVELSIYKVPGVAVTVTASSSPVWPADGAYYTVAIAKDSCVTDVEVSCSLANTTITEIVAGSEYRVTLSNRCVPNQSDQLINGAITVASSALSEPSVTPISYTSKTGSWTNYNLTWQSPAKVTSETLYSDTISGNIRTVLYRYVSAWPSYQEVSSVVSCNYCRDGFPSTRVYTTDKESFTREPSYLIPVIGLSHTTYQDDISSNMPCCEYVGTMARNWWVIPSRKETYEWVCI